MEPAATAQNPSLIKIEATNFETIPTTLGGTELFRWKNLCENNEVFHVVLIRNGDQLEYRLLNRKGTVLRGGMLPNECEEVLKTTEPVLERQECLTFSKPLVDWDLLKEQRVRIRCLFGQAQAYWQTYDPFLDIRTTMPFIADAGPGCSEVTKRLIHSLDPQNPEHAHLLPFLKCVRLKFREKATLEPLSAPSTFNSKCKVNYFKWAVTLITHEGLCGNHALIVVEGIADQAFAAKFKKNASSVELKATQSFLALFHFTGQDIRLSFVREIEFTHRSPIIMLDSMPARAMLESVLESKTPVFSVLGVNSCLNGKVTNLIAKLTIGLSAEANGHNCYTWARDFVKKNTGVEFGSALLSSIISLPKTITHLPEYYINNPEEF